MAFDVKSGRRSRGGRPRDPSLDQRILDATIELLPQQGIDGTSMDDIASRAGVSKPTIYRRWTSKELLIIDALAASLPPLNGIDADDPREGLVDVVVDILFLGTGGPAGMLGRLSDPPTPDPELASQFEARVVNPQRRTIAGLLQRAIDAGSLSADADIETSIDLLYGAAFFRRSRVALRFTEHGASTRETAQRIVDVLWRGLGGEARRS